MMKTSHILGSGIILILLFNTGCTIKDGKVTFDPLIRQKVSVTPESPQMVPQNSNTLQERFSENQNSDALEDAVAWSEKYEQLFEKNTQLQEENMRLFQQHANAKSQLEKATMELAQARKELEDANEFMRKMHEELNNWKSDVLGFRSEIRNAQAAELTALTKILKILGAEPIRIEEQSQGSSAVVSGSEK